MRRQLHSGALAIVAVASLAMTSVAAAQVDAGEMRELEHDDPEHDDPELDDPEHDGPELGDPELDEPEFGAAEEALPTRGPIAHDGGDATAFGGAEAFLADSEAPWILDDGVGVEELPWDSYDREVSYVPRGLVHAGAQLRIAGVFGGGMNVPDGPLFELSGFVDIRYRQSSPWRVRLAIAASVQAWNEAYLGAGTLVSSSPLSLRTRVLFLNVDLGRWINMRAGGDLGIQWTPGGGDGRVDIAGGPTAEVTLLLLDGALEIGVAGGMQLTAYTRLNRDYSSTSYAPGAVIGGTVAYVIP